MNKEEYTQMVLSKLPTIDNPRCRELVIHDIEQKFNEGWTVQETSNILWWCENVSPDIEERKALKQINRIENMVQQRLKG